MIAVAVAAIVSVTITVISLLLMEQSNQEQAYAQNQTQVVTNFTQLFSTDKAFEICRQDLDEPIPLYINESEFECTQTIAVLHEDPHLLVLESEYLDAIWDGVALAQKEGYQIDTMTSYVTGRTTGSGSVLYLLVAMSK